MLEMENISYEYTTRSRKGPSGAGVKALNGISLSVSRGETLGIIGETGSGKSTIGMIAVGQLKSLTGQVKLDQKHLSIKSDPGRVQMVFQDPISSLNPRMTIEQIITEPLMARKWGTSKDRRELAAELIEKVGLKVEHLERRRGEFSGGQCQRIAIARAVITHPEFIVLDEPTSSLDVIVQAKILKLLEDIKSEYQTGYLFISHNLAVVEAVADRVIVLYRGHVVEQGKASEVLANPIHPYTKALADAVLDIEMLRKRNLQIKTQPVPALNMTADGKGCPYKSLCPIAIEKCGTETPALTFSNGRRVACHVIEANEKGLSLFKEEGAE